jgi:hypothetical protein
MTMQYDVKQAHLNQSGILVPYSTRVKAVAFVGTATAGQFVLFDTTTAPVSASVTYARSGNTITVSKTAHGLLAGDKIGIDFDAGSGGAATTGNYTITGTPTNTGTFNFTVTTVSVCSNTSISGLTIVVNPGPTISLATLPATTNQTVCNNAAISNIAYNIGGSGTGANVSGLPAGVTGAYRLFANLLANKK